MVAFRGKQTTAPLKDEWVRVTPQIAQLLSLYNVPCEVVTVKELRKLFEPKKKKPNART